MNLLNVVNDLCRADLSEVVYQVQKLNPDMTAEGVVQSLKELEDERKVQVEIIVSLTDGGRECL